MCVRSEASPLHLTGRAACGAVPRHGSSRNHLRASTEAAAATGVATLAGSCAQAGGAIPKHLRAQQRRSLHKRDVAGVCGIPLQRPREALGRAPEQRAGAGGRILREGVHQLRNAVMEVHLRIMQGLSTLDGFIMVAAAALGQGRRHRCQHSRQSHAIHYQGPRDRCKSEHLLSASLLAWNFLRAHSMQSSMVLQRSVTSTSTTLSSCSLAAASLACHTGTSIVT